MPRELRTVRMPGNPFERTYREDEKKKEDVLKAVDAVLERIKVEGPNLPREDMFIITARVMEHGTLDGLKVSEILKLTPKEILEICTRPEYAQKHPAVIGHLLTFTQERSMTKEYGLFEQAEQAASYVKSYENLKLESAEARELYAAIDQAYADLLWSTRDIANKGYAATRQQQEREMEVRRLGIEVRQPEASNSQEQLVDSYLNKISLALQGGYYAAPVRDQLEKMVDEAGRQSEQYLDFQWRLSTDLQVVTEVELDEMCRELSLDASELKKAVQKDRYVLYPQLLKYEKIAAKAEVKKRLERQLSPDERIELNTEKNRYEIVENETGETKMEKPRYEEIPLPGFHDISQMVEVNGKIYVSGGKNQSWAIRDISSGKRIEGEYPVEYKGQLYWIQRNTIMSENGEVMSFPEFTSLYDLAVIDGKLHFQTVTRDRESLIERHAIHRIDGPKKIKDFSQPHARIRDFTEVNGRLVYAWESGNKQAVQDAQNGPLDIKFDTSQNRIGSMVSVGEKLYFWVHPMDGHSSYLSDQEGRNYGKCDGIPVAVGDHVYYPRNGGLYDEAGNQHGKDYLVAKPFNLGGKLAYVTNKGNQTTLVIEHPPAEKTKKKEYRFDNLEDVGNLQSAGGKLYFTAKDTGTDKFSIRDLDNHVYGHPHRTIKDIIDCNGEILFVSLDNNVTVIRDLKDNIRNRGHEPAMINGILHFDVTRPGKYGSYMIVNAKGEKYGLEFSSAFSAADIKGELFFTAKSKTHKTFVANSKGDQYGLEYDEAHNPIEYQGKLCFLARKGSDKMLVDGDGKVLIGPYHDINNWCIIGEEFYAEVFGDGKEIIVDTKGNEYGTEYDRVTEPVNYNDRLAYKAFSKSLDESFIVVEGEEPEKKKHEKEIYLPYDVIIDGPYQTNEGTKVFIEENGDRFLADVLTGEKSILQPMRDAWLEQETTINGKLYYVGRGPTGKRCVMTKEKLYGPENKNSYLPFEYEGKLWFASSEGNEHFLCSENGEVIGKGKGYKDIIAAKVYDNELYIAVVTKDLQEDIVDSKGVSYLDNPLSSATRDFVIKNGKIYLETTSTRNGNERHYITDTEGNPVFDENDQGDLTVIGGKIYHRSLQQNGIALCIKDEDGHVYGTEYDFVDKPHELAGKLAYLAKKDGKHFLVLEDSAKDEVPTEKQKLLDLLNLVHDPSKEGIAQYLMDQEMSKPVDLTNLFSSFSSLEKSFAVAKGLNEALRDIPEAFLASIAARRDRSSEKLADKLASVMFPKEYRKGKWDKQSWLGFLKSAVKFVKGESLPDVAGVLESRESDTNLGGDREFTKDKRTVLEFREPMHGFMVTSLLGSYEGGAWHRSYIPLNRTPNGTTKMTTITIPNIHKGQELDLPIPIDAALVTERVRGIRKNKEIALEPKQDSLGLYRTESLPQLDQLAYSVTMSEVPEPMYQATQTEILELRNTIERTHGREMTKELAALPEEVSAFLESQDYLKLEPREQIMAIQDFVKQSGYYDFDNEEMSKLKAKASLEDKIMLCELKLEELKSKKGDDPALQGRRWAGVCADFAEITCAILRKAGFVSGIATGFAVNGMKANVSDSHSAAFVVLPDGQGGMRPIIIDGTPSGNDPRVEATALPTLAEAEKTAITKAEETRTEAYEELKEIMAAIAEDANAVRSIDNGKLEKLANAVLTGTVHQQNVAMVQEMLDLYRYGGIYRMDPLKQKVAIKQTIEEYLLTRPERKTAPSKKAPGTQLFEAVEDFNKYIKSNGGDLTRSLEILDYIKAQAKDALDLMESPGLSKTNKPLAGTTELALDAAIQYLRGRNISGSAR